jgi:CheY-like chemotaxis protein
MPKGGRLVVQTGRKEIDHEEATLGELATGDYAVVAVTDTGAGMSPEVRRRAFEPFFTTKEVGKGSGLGLSMVYGFVKQSGGHVQLYSEVGHGTTVRIYLPIGAGAAATPVEGQRREAVASPIEKVVLVVEDDPRVRRVSVRRLKELGYGVIEAESGPGALKILERGDRIDLVFSDVVMAGGMTGIDLAQEVRRRWPELKILLTSGYADPAAIQDGLTRTAAGWLGKPYSARELQAKLNELFAL